MFGGVGRVALTALVATMRMYPLHCMQHGARMSDRDFACQRVFQSWPLLWENSASFHLKHGVGSVCIGLFAEAFRHIALQGSPILHYTLTLTSVTKNTTAACWRFFSTHMSLNSLPASSRHVR